MSFISPFIDLRSSDTGKAGGKGASLGELTAAGIPVPPGFVVLTGAFTAFLATAGLERAAAHPETGLREELLAAPIPESVAAAILQAYDEANLGKVAVRSSATAEDSGETAWAGQLDTFLEVERAQLLDRVRECWASLYTDRALAYGQEQSAGAGEIAVAVVVQQMVDAEVAGVGFSVHPVTQEPDLMMIQGAPGLGEAVVSGQVNPDTWVIDKSLALVEQAVGKKLRALRPGKGWVELGEEGLAPSLSDTQALEYGRILRDVERHYGRPMDTEWALRNGQFYVLQARPVTTLDPGYDQPFYEPSLHWTAKHRRPWSLFAASLFAGNLEASALRLGIEPLAVLEVEIATDMVQICLVDEHYQRWLDGVARYSREQPHDMEALLRHGLALEEEVRGYKTGPLPWNSLDEVLPYFRDVMTTTTQVPFGVLDALQNDPSPQARTLVELAEKLRSDSDYPWFLDSVFPPLVQRRAEETGLARLGDPHRLATLKELAAPEPPLQVWQERAERLKAGDLFVFQLLEGEETVTMHPQTGFVLARLNGARVPRSGGEGNVLHGSAAYPGVVEGTARIVARPKDAEGFQEGDILVSVNANPSLMSCIIAASAIVTDEGGAACHAAIVARELKKPCLIGTSDATTRIPQGARIRVDALEQTVTLLD